MAFVLKLLALLRRGLRVVFGDWQWSPPPWLRGLINHPRQTALAAVVLFGVSWIAPTLYQWITAPDPEAPPKARLEASEVGIPVFATPTVMVPPLNVQISQGVAKLDLVGQTLSGVVMKPDVPGTWRFLADDQLQFIPDQHWPIGASVAIRFPQSLFKPEAEFESLELEVAVPAFALSLGSVEFYQDPVDPDKKKSIVQFRFTHPVERRSFEQAVALRAVDGGGTELANPTFQVIYGDYDLSAYVHSETLQVPRNGGRLWTSVAPGVQAVLGGSPSAEAVEGLVDLPSRYSLQVTGVEFVVAESDSEQPQQVLIVSTNNAVKDSDLAKRFSVYQLPKQHPDPKVQGERQDPYPWQWSDISEAVLKASSKLKLSPIPGEREVLESHSFRFEAAPGTLLYYRVERDLASFGGFLLAEDASAVIAVGEYPAMLELAGEGALLALRGERRLTVASRNKTGFSLEVARLLPRQLHHLVKENNGSFQSPELWDIELDQLTDRVIKHVDLKASDPAARHYEGVDLGAFLASDRRGVFQVSLFDRTDDESIDRQDVYPVDRRLIVLTDLGLLSKRTIDGGRDIYVQELSSGRPAVGARVSILSINGETLESAWVGTDGHVRLNNVDDYRREKRALTLIAERDDDLSFLPLQQSEHSLDFSRFSIGGDANPTRPEQLDAFLFSDRGIYRPGDTVHLGLLLRAYDWSHPLSGVPLQATITDPRGAVVLNQKLAFNAEGFRDLSLATNDASSTGSYRAELRLLDANDVAGDLIGSTHVQVQEFQPDRLKARILFDPVSDEGWVSPEQLSARVEVRNLFGTPAQDRRVTATLNLTPSRLSFERYPDFSFVDPQRARRSFSETLAESQTDADGIAGLSLNLEQYDRASYEVELLIEAFEADGGRGVGAVAHQRVSRNPYLVGLKSRDSLDYVKRKDPRILEVLAIAPNLAPISPEGLQQRLVEIAYVSVLARQESGVYKYQSERRERIIDERPLVLTEGRASITLDTSKPGQYRLEVVDSSAEDGPVVLNQRHFQVAGEANVSRTLERNAELQLTLADDDVAPGETLEVAINAPYIGSGLITLERDKVYAHAWFRSETTSSVQRIQIPTDFEGSGYINVQFLRDPSSPEIYMSPLSYAVLPFSAGKQGRTQALRIEAPNLIKPGQEARFVLHTDAPTQAVLYAVDEGILNVANYRLPEPLEYFFRKRVLDVASDQILSLLLPEFSQLRGDAAPGGDAESTLNNQLNPFKRKRDKPAAYWSGVVPVNGRQEFTYRVPETFNGRLKVMAVAVNQDRMGTAEGATLVRDDFILSPNVPTTVAPGDQFEISVGVANQTEGVEQIELKLTADSGLKLLDPPSQTLAVPFNGERSARFKVEALAEVGAAGLALEASAGKRSVVRRVELSVRPPVPFQVQVRAGRLAGGEQQRIGELRAMWPAFSTRTASISATPLVLVHGLRDTLEHFPHQCSEQLISKGFAHLLLAERPEWRPREQRSQGTGADSVRLMRALYTVLTERQGSHGGIGLWLASPDPEPFVTAYAALLLLEAQERQLGADASLQQPIMAYLRVLAADDAKRTLPELRVRALAAYVLTRQGVVTTDLLALIAQTLRSDFPNDYASDAAASMIAASYALLKKDDTAAQWLIGPIARLRLSARETSNDGYYYDYYDDPYIRDAWHAFVLARHFPERRVEVQADALDRLSAGVMAGRTNTLSAALSLLAMDAFGDQQGDVTTLELAMIKGAASAERSEPFGEWIGALREGAYPDGLTALRFANDGKAPVWYSTREAGFDRVAPTRERRDGIELVRDFVTADGKPVRTLTAGDEIFVRLRLRSVVPGKDQASIAIIDMLPGGFEVVQPRPTEDIPVPAATTGLGNDDMSIEYQDVREDRVLVYSVASDRARQFSYAIKATNPGRYQLPAGYAMSMYDNQVVAVQPSLGSIEVVAARDVP